MTSAIYVLNVEMIMKYDDDYISIETDEQGNITLIED
jgi:hypothetical protein